MARGPKKHLKRIRAPKSWMMDKLSGVFTVRPAQGPHKLRESLPLQIVLRDKLKLALNSTEVDHILHQQEGLIQIDKKVRRNPKFPCGLMDVIDIPRMNKSYRLLYDVKGRFTLVKLKQKENEFKLCRIQKKFIGPNKICYLTTHDGRTLKFVDPEIEINDTVKLNLKTGKVVDYYKFRVGNTVFCNAGNNIGRVGIVQHINKFSGQFDLVTVKDAQDNQFTTRVNYVMIIGNGDQSEIALPKDKGVKKSILQEMEEIKKRTGY